MDEIMKELARSIIDSCAELVEKIPASRSLYENEQIAKAVIEFKNRAVKEILTLKP